MQQEATSGETRTILVVDDEDLLVELLRRMITRHGYSVVTARSAREALEIFDAGDAKIDLVITDLVMPDVDGKSLAEQLMREHPGTRILVSTGYSAVDDIHSLLSQGIKGVVYKPYQSEQLYAKIDDAFKS